jgi:hypothetical protein
MRAGRLYFQLLIYHKGEIDMRNEEIGRIVLATNKDIKSLLDDTYYWQNYYTGLEDLSDFEKRNVEEGNSNYLVVVHDIDDSSIVLFVCVGNEDQVNYTSLIDSIKTLRKLTLDMIEACDMPVEINLKNLCSKKEVNIDDDAIEELFRIYFTGVYKKFNFIKNVEGVKIYGD